MLADVKIIDSSSEFWPSGITGVERLWCVGKLSLLKMPSIAVVGTRTPSERGKLNTRSVVDTVGSRYAIVSGLALGIDGVAHIESLARGFNTIAVLPTPIDQCYPKEHVKLLEEIAENGLVVSQFRPEDEVQKYFFMLRNQLISQISSASVVVESSDGGGGVKEAKYAEKQGKPVFVFREVYENRAYLWPRSFSSPVLIDRLDDILKELDKNIKDYRNKEQLMLF